MNEPTNEHFLWRWIRQLIRWIRDRSGAEVEPKILEEHHTDTASLYLLECDKPGVVDMWKLVHKTSQRDLIISLVNIAQLREDLARYRLSGGKATGYRDWRRQIALQLGKDLEASYEVDATHILMAVFCTRARFRRVGASGNVEFVHRTECACIIPCDLEGHTRAWTAGNLHARKIVRAIALRMMRLQSDRFSWEDLARATNWYELLDAYAKQVFGKFHLLQPRKSTFRG